MNAFLRGFGLVSLFSSLTRQIASQEYENAASVYVVWDGSNAAASRIVPYVNIQ